MHLHYIHYMRHRFMFVIPHLQKEHKDIVVVLYNTYHNQPQPDYHGDSYSTSRATTDIVQCYSRLHDNADLLQLWANCCHRNAARVSRY